MSTMPLPKFNKVAWVAISAVIFLAIIGLGEALKDVDLISCYVIPVLLATYFIGYRYGIAFLVLSFAANLVLTFLHDRAVPIQTVVGLLVHIGSYVIVIVLIEMIRKRTDMLRQSLAEKTIIIGDIHHRMKNQMSTMLSFIELSDLSNPAKALEALKGKLKTYFILYNKLCYGNQSQDKVELHSYLKDIIQGNLDSKGNDRGSIDYRINCPEMILANKDAISIGLIVNELTTNSLKYAFNGRPTGLISLTVALLHPSRGFQIVYADDGCGFVYDPHAADNKLGSIMVDSLTRQMYGSVRHSNQGGSIFTFRFDEIEFAGAESRIQPGL